MKFAAGQLNPLTGRYEVIDTYRVTTDRWKRTWQAEWVNPATQDYPQSVPRAWTRRGVLRKAWRQYRRDNS